MCIIIDSKFFVCKFGERPNRIARHGLRQDWIKATAAAPTLHRRLLTVLEGTAEGHSSRTGTRSPTNQPILTSDACRAMINTSAGSSIYQALRRLLRSSFTGRQSVADWFWFGVMEAQYDGLVSGDADRGKKGCTIGLTARAQWGAA